MWKITNNSVILVNKSKYDNTREYPLFYYIFKENFFTF